MQAPLLDTHAWIWYAGDPSRLDRAELDALDGFDFEDRPLVSDFSLWEIATLMSLGRLTLDRPLERWLLLAARPAVICTADHARFFIAFKGLVSNRGRGLILLFWQRRQTNEQAVGSIVVMDLAAFHPVTNRKQ